MSDFVIKLKFIFLIVWCSWLQPTVITQKNNFIKSQPFSNYFVVTISDLVFYIYFLDEYSMCLFPATVRVVYHNYKVVVFQPWKLTPSHLGSSCLSLHFKTSPSAPPFSSTVFWITPPPLSYRLPIRSCSSSKPSHFSLAPHLLFQFKLPPT